uniref:ATP synthase F0 subunit 8 n=1 Tax=Macrophiothrix sp. TaxID=3135532 RepID=A0AAU6PXC0_9ECHI
MPQLEFTIWLSNAIINWTIFTAIVLVLNSQAIGYNYLSTTIRQNSVQTSNNNWPWTS